MNFAVLRHWWQSREARERRVLVLGGVLLGVMLAWAFAWYPLGRAQATLATRLETQRQDLDFMQRAESELSALREQGGANGAERGGKSLLALVDATARASELGVALKRIEPIDDRRVRVEFADAGFDQLAAWLDGLQRDYGIAAEDVSIDRGAGEGVVDARLTVQEP